jgi:hypothetical protein
MAALARPAVDRGIHVRVEAASKVNMADPKVALRALVEVAHS